MERRSLLAAGVASLLVRPSADPPIRRSAGFRAPPEEFLRALPRLLDLSTTPGLSAAVLSGGKTAWSAGFGRTGTEGTPAVNADTVFEAASLSKPVFAYLVMLLVQDGLIDLDRPIDGYLGQPYVPGNELAAKITARHVLSHTTGYRNWRFNDSQTLEPAFTPGERWQYSGEGYYELQRAIETITGRDLTALARERIFIPFDMTRSSYVPLPEFDANRATGHRRGGQPVGPPGPGAPPGHLPAMLTPNAAGSLRTTANDYPKFLAIMTGATQGPLEDSHRTLMYQPAVVVRDSLHWGLGWGIEKYEGGNLIWHWGDGLGWKNFVIADPVAKEGIVVFTNGDGGKAVYERVVRASAGFDPAAFTWI